MPYTTSLLPYHINFLNSRNSASYTRWCENEATNNFHMSPHIPSMEPARSSCLAGILTSSFYFEKNIFNITLKIFKD